MFALLRPLNLSITSDFRTDLITKRCWGLLSGVSPGVVGSNGESEHRWSASVFCVSPLTILGQVNIVTPQWNHQRIFSSFSKECTIWSPLGEEFAAFFHHVITLFVFFQYLKKFWCKAQFAVGNLILALSFLHWYSIVMNFEESFQSVYAIPWDNWWAFQIHLTSKPLVHQNLKFECSQIHR